MKLKKLITEGLVGHYKLKGHDLYVDSNLLNKINSLKLDLTHMGMGDFKTKKPIDLKKSVGKTTLVFNRVSEKIPNFAGRAHRVTLKDEDGNTMNDIKLVNSAYKELIQLFKKNDLVEYKINETKLVDDVYKALSMHIKGFDKLGMDEQGEVTMKVEKILKNAGLK